MFAQIAAFLFSQALTTAGASQLTQTLLSSANLNIQVMGSALQLLIRANAHSNGYLEMGVEKVLEAASDEISKLVEKL